MDYITFQAQLTIDILRGKSWRNFIHMKEEKGICYLLDSLGRPLFYQACDIAGCAKKCPVAKVRLRLFNAFSLAIYSQIAEFTIQYNAISF